MESSSISSPFFFLSFCTTLLIIDFNVSLTGRVAIVTGASSGNGRAIATLLANHGASVVCSDLVPELRAGGYEKFQVPTHELIVQNKGKATFQKADVSSDGSMRSLIDEAVKEHKRVDM